MSELSLEEQAVNYATLRHIESVRNVLNAVIVELLKRGESHDQLKLEQPELSGFLTHTHKLGSTEYNSPEYKAMLEELKPTLAHHYANYRHHPEHFPNGLDDMNLVDIIEMFCDWKASTSRNKNGNLLQSIENNRSRFRMSDQMINVFKNTATLFDEKKF
jgi:hypothetical protein